jgi:glycosyltransferase involved in cell wall biosynthesis
MFKNLFFQSRRFVRNNSKTGLLIELDSFDKGGLQKVVLDIALKLPKNIFETVIVSVNKVGYLASIAKKNGINVYQLPSVGKTRFLEGVIKKHNIVLSNSHFSDFGYAVYAKHKIKNVTFIHNIYAFLNGSALDGFKKNDAYVDCYISVSPKATEYAVQVLGVNPDKIVTVPNGLIIDEHLDRIKNATPFSRSDFGIAVDDYVFINPASYNLHKGHYLMADAMISILKQRSDIKILCIGNVVYEPHYHEFTSFLRDRGLERYILLPGYFPNIEDIYPIVDAFLMPSFIEGWSIAMNEAMFYKVPLIMTDTGGASEVIEGSDIGILVENEYGSTVSLRSDVLDRLTFSPREYNVTPQLASAMIDFASNRDKWRLAGQKGREKILKNYDFNKIVEKYVQVFVSLI